MKNNNCMGICLTFPDFFLKNPVLEISKIKTWMKETF
jgi:hypothetical protein